MPSKLTPIALAGLTACLTGCSSLSGDVKSYSVDYGSAMSQFLNEQILTNILRASANTPLHFSELGQVNGSLQEQVQIGATIPFGKYTGASKSADQLSPQVTFASSPTFTISPLDTQAFTVGLMQPIDASYLVNLLASSDEPTKELLLFLFVDSIDNADGKHVPQDFRGKPHLRNTLDNTDFRDYVSKLVSKAEFREVTVLTPLGPQFLIDPTGKNSYKLTELLPIADEVSVHLAKTQEKAKAMDEEYRLFHIWSDQLALCYEPTAALAGIELTSPALPAAPFSDGIALFSETFKSKVGGKGGGSAGGSNNAGSPATKGGRGGGGGLAPTVATPLMPLAGFVVNSQCFGPIYLESKVEDRPPKGTDPIQEFQINLRSVRGVIEYLGAFVAAKKELKTVDGQTTLFSLKSKSHDDAARANSNLSVTYEKSTYVVRSQYTAKAVQILSELVDSLKLSSDIATTKQVQIIP
jgi:hypothetical protein